MKAEAPTGGNGGEITTYVRPAMMQRSASRLLPAHATVAEAVEVFKRNPQGSGGIGIADQLFREMAGPFSYLAVKSGGRAEAVSASTRLADIAAFREVRGSHGLERVPKVEICVQAYLPVGGSDVSVSLASS